MTGAANIAQRRARNLTGGAKSLSREQERTRNDAQRRKTDMASTQCLNCLERRVGCHSTCAKYAALCEENKAKKEYLKDGKDVCSFLKAGYLKRKRRIN